MTPRRLDVDKFHVQSATDTATGEHVVALLLRGLGDLESTVYGMPIDLAHDIGSELIAAAHNAQLWRDDPAGVRKKT